MPGTISIEKIAPSGAWFQPPSFGSEQRQWHALLLDACTVVMIVWGAAHCGQQPLLLTALHVLLLACNNPIPDKLDLIGHFLRGGTLTRGNDIRVTPGMTVR